MKEQLIDKAKERGYWRINFKPTESDKDRLSLSECSKIIERNNVTLRGWDYPHVEPKKRPDDFGLSGVYEDYYESWTDWGGHIEFWRMYTSGQFLHYRALAEDWQKERNASIETRLGGFALIRGTIPDEPFLIMDIGRTIFLFVEVFEFLRRMASDTHSPYDTGVIVDVELNNVRSRRLYDSTDWIEEFRRYCTNASKISLEATLSSEQILLESADLAIQNVLDFFDHFTFTPVRGFIQKRVDECLTPK